MGSVLSSKRDFNRVLAQQPRASVDILKFRTPNTSFKGQSINAFSIPDPVRMSESDRQNQNTSLPSPPYQSQAVNQYPPVIQKLEQSSQANVSPPMASMHSTPIINNRIQPGPENRQEQQQFIDRTGSRFSPSDQPIHHERMNGDVVVHSRSIINTNDQQYSRDHHVSSIQPDRTIVEHNGKQFVIETKQRLERCYAQYLDETTNRLRVFEVIDYIPCKIVRPYKYKSQSSTRDDFSHEKPRFAHRTNQYLTPSLTSNNRLETTSSSNSTKDKSLSYNNINVSRMNNNSEDIYEEYPTTSYSYQSSRPLQSMRRSATDSINDRSRHSQLNSLNYPYYDLQNNYVPNRNSQQSVPVQPASFQTHTPTNSDYTASSGETDPSDVDEESETEDTVSIQRSNERTNLSFINHRNNSILSDGTSDQYRSTTVLDPFARPENSIERHPYRSRPNINNYSELMMNNRHHQKVPHSDYAPIPMMNKQPNQNQDSRRNGYQ